MNGSRTLALAAAMLVCGRMPAGADKRPDAGPYAILAGTVFRDPGFALAAILTRMVRTAMLEPVARW